MAEYGCFFCGKGKVSDLTDSCPSCGNPVDVGEMLLKADFEGFRPRSIRGRGFYGYVLHAQNRIGRDVALKVVPETLYAAHGKDFYEEVSRYQTACPHPSIADLYDAGEKTIVLFGKEVRHFFLVMEYVGGAVALDDFVATNSLRVDDFIGIALQLGAALTRLEARGLWHNDLQARNILVADADETDLARDPSITKVLKIVDLGSAVFGNPAAVKQMADTQWFGRHLQTIVARIRETGAPDTSRERHFMRNVDRTFADTFDDSPERRPSASDVVDRVKRLREFSGSARHWQPPQLESASAFTNALTFPDDSYVATLFSDRFPWLTDIVSAQQPLVMTGPRGCGKTMILLHARLRTILSKREEHESIEDRLSRLNESPHVGFFASCRLSFHLYLGTGESPKWAETPRLSALFLNLLYLFEVADSLMWAATEGFDLLSRSDEQELSSVLSDMLSDLPAGAASNGFGGAAPLQSVRDRVGGLLERLVRDDLPTESIPADLATVRPLRQTSGWLVQHCEAFRGKRILFLLDDFSSGIVPEPMQRALLPLVFGTVPEHVFWVSAHGMSVPRQDLRGVDYQPNREFVSINLGWEYARRTMPEQLAVCRAFLDDVFRRRFSISTSAFQGTLAELLGGSSYGEYGDDLATHIRELKRQRKLHALNYHGVETVTKLCTGDISYVIDLVGKVLTDRNGDGPVRQDLQNRRIRQYARQELLCLQAVYDYGQILYEVAKRFGKLSQMKLLGAPVGEEERPGEYLSIELKRDRVLPDKWENLLRQLVRQGVFIDGPGTQSNTGDVTLLLLYRRLFAPAAPTSLNDRDSFPWTATGFVKFLSNPSAFVQAQAKQEEAEANKAEQETLFDDEDLE